MRLCAHAFMAQWTQGVWWPDGPFLTLNERRSNIGTQSKLNWDGSSHPHPLPYTHTRTHSSHACFFILCELWQLSGDHKMPGATSGHFILCAHSSLNNTHMHTTRTDTDRRA